MRTYKQVVGLFMVIICFCVYLNYKPRTYNEQTHAYAALVCQTKHGPGVVPPLPFTQDGCSMFPDGDWAHACYIHDIMYWCGGDFFDRVLADLILGQTVGATHEYIGPLMYTGVRMGGVYWIPAPTFRWGYGWPYPRTGPEK